MADGRLGFFEEEARFLIALLILPVVLGLVIGTICVAAFSGHEEARREAQAEEEHTGQPGQLTRTSQPLSRPLLLARPRAPR